MSANDLARQIRRKKIYDNYKFNGMDKQLRDKGLYCEILGDIAEFRFLVGEINDMLRGKQIAWDRKRGNYQSKLENQFAIVPAQIVLSRKSLKKLLEETNGRLGGEKFEERDLYAYYTNPALEHSEYAQTRGWPPTKSDKKK